MMHELAKAGFTQSYTYFTWRNAKWELEEYLAELTTPPVRDFFRANFFANTPDILPEFLQRGGRPAFHIRAVLAAMASPVYGIYSGFELCENTPVPGKEEYLDSEKYQFKGRDWNAPGNIKGYLARLNKIRSENRALRGCDNLRLHKAENDNILFFSKSTESLDNTILVAVTLDPYNGQGGFVTVPLGDFGIGEDEEYVLEDLISGEWFHWRGARNFVGLDPHQRPAHIFRLRRQSGREAGQVVFA
jgi:starch synthase (maltosyl-transferring)